MIPKKTLTVTREDTDTGAYNADGDWVKGTTSQFTITASVQPLTGKEMELLPEGRRESQSYKLYSATKLLTVKTAPKDNADLVTYDGRNFEVLIVEDWQNSIINHYKIIVVEL